jgi:FAD/FMN-containing dehydrogenase
MTISRTVREFYEENIPFRIFHGSSNSTRAAARQQVVDISSLNHVLHIDRVKKTALVEPGIAMDELVKELLPHNLMPAVVPNFLASQQAARSLEPQQRVRRSAMVISTRLSTR